MTERQRNYWLRACTEAKSYVILNKKKLAEFKQLENCLKYLEVAKADDIATYIKLHPNSDVATFVMGAVLQSASNDDVFFTSLSDLNKVREEYIKHQVDEVSKIRIDASEGGSSNDANAG